MVVNKLWEMKKSSAFKQHILGPHYSLFIMGLGIIVCLFGLILYVQSTIFQLYTGTGLPWLNK